MAVASRAADFINTELLGAGPEVTAEAEEAALAAEGGAYVE